MLFGGTGNDYGYSVQPTADGGYVIAGLDPPTPGGDANQDGSVDAVDITRVERIIARLD